jgi:hypothetical protein
MIISKFESIIYDKVRFLLAYSPKRVNVVVSDKLRPADSPESSYFQANLARLQRFTSGYISRNSTPSLPFDS